MTLHQLRIFAEVAAHNHVTRAAENLNLTQSAVSGAIRTLEEQHDIVLFNRIGRRVELSPDGLVFLEKARAVLRSADAAQQSILELRGLKRGIVDLHASQTTGAYWLPERITRFHRKYPQIDVRMSLGNTDQVAAAVADGSAEIGFIEGTIRQPDLITTEVDRDQLVIVVSAAHPFGRLRRLTASQVTDVEWVLRERGSGTRSVFERALGKLGIAPDRLKIALELPSNEAVRAAVEAGAGLTAISHAIVAAALRSRNLRSLRFVPLERPFMLLRHPERAFSIATTAFLTTIGVAVS